MKSRSLSVFLVFLTVFSLVGLAAPPRAANAAVTGTLTISNSAFTQDTSVSPAVTQAKAYFSVTSPHNAVGIEVKDADLNVRKSLPGTGTVPTVGPTPFEIIGPAGTTPAQTPSFTLVNASATTPVADVNRNGVVTDDLIVRTLQDGAAFGIVSATSSGSITVASPGPTLVNSTKFNAPSTGASQALTTAMVSTAKLRVTITVPGGVTFTNIVISGTSVAPGTLATASDSETITAVGPIATSKFFAPGATFTVTATAAVTVLIEELNTVIAQYQTDQVDNLFANVTVTSTTHAAQGFAARVVNLSEGATTVGAGASSGIFRGTVKLVKETSDPCFAPSTTANGGAGCADIVDEPAVSTSAASYAGAVLVADGDTITVTYNDALNASSVAQATTATAKVDLAPPVLTLRSPASASATNIGTVTFSVDVADTGAGVDDTAITSGVTAASSVFSSLPSPTATPATAASVSPVAKAVLAQRIDGTTIVPTSVNYTVFATGVVDGSYKWNVNNTNVKDRVGNIVVSLNTVDPAVEYCGNNATKGSSANKWSVNVGTTKPAISGAKTGVAGLVDTRVQEVGVRTYPDIADVRTKPPGSPLVDPVAAPYPGQPVNCSTSGKLTDDTNINVTKVDVVVGDPGQADGSATKKYTTDLTKKGTAATAVKVSFTTAASTKIDLDKATVAAADFLVGGVAPTKVALAKATGVVYLTMPLPLATDAVPAVEVVGAIADAAGNILDPATLTDAEKTASIHKLAAAADGLAPKLTVKTDVAIAKDKATITVTSSEALPTAATLAACVDANDNKACGDAGETPVAGIGTVTMATSTQHTATWIVTPGTMTMARVVVTGSDAAGSPGTSFADIELDTKANGGVNPTIQPAGASSVDRQNPWVIVSFVGENSRAVASAAACTTAGGTVNANITKFADGTAIAGVWCENAGEYPLMTAATSGDTHKTVTLTSATLDDTDVKAKFTTADSITYTLATSGLSLGSHTVALGFKDDAGNTGTSSIAFTVTAKQPIQIALNPGWNLISVPGALDDPSVSSVFAGMTTVQRVYGFDATVGWQLSTFDAATGKWSGSLAEIRDGKGYWVFSTGAAPIKVFVAERQPTTPLPQYELAAGWNLIGFSSLANEANTAVDSYLLSLGAGTAKKWTTLVSFNPNPAIGYQTAKGNLASSAGFDVAGGVAQVMQGKGYWIYLTSAGVLAP